MSESVELCIHITTPTTPRHHRDEELPMPNARICRTVCTDQQLVNSSNIDNLRIYRTVDDVGGGGLLGDQILLPWA